MQHQRRTSKYKRTPLHSKKNGQPQSICRPQSQLKGFRVRLDFAEKDFIELVQ